MTSQRFTDRIDRGEHHWLWRWDSSAASQMGLFIDLDRKLQSRELMYFEFESICQSAGRKLIEVGAWSE